MHTSSNSNDKAPAGALRPLTPEAAARVLMRAFGLVVAAAIAQEFGDACERFSEGAFHWSEVGREIDRTVFSRGMPQ